MFSRVAATLTFLAGMLESSFLHVLPTMSVCLVGWLVLGWDDCCYCLGHYGECIVSSLSS